jgi:hypothetical protein
MKKQPFTLDFSITIAAGLLLIFGLAAAVPADGLPPRPDTTPTAVPSLPAHVRGAQIILTQTSTVAFPHEAWTVLQWQSATGTWYDVEGWQGTFDPDGQVIWWVGPEHLGENNFRWQVYRDQGRSDLLATSDTFDLPQHSGQRVIVQIALP